MWGSPPPARGGTVASGRSAGQFSFYVSCDINLPVRIKVSELQGLLPAFRNHHLSLPASLTPAAAGLLHNPSPNGAVAIGHDATCSASTYNQTTVIATTSRILANCSNTNPLGNSNNSSSSSGVATNTNTTNNTNSASSLYVTARITSFGDTLGLEAQTGFATARAPPPPHAPNNGNAAGAVAGGGGDIVGIGGGGGLAAEAAVATLAGNGGGGGEGCDEYEATAQWDEWLTFCVKYRDLPSDAQLALSLWEVAPGRGPALLGSCVMRLFSKRGRLKTGPQRLRLWEGVPPCTALPSSTPGKVPLAHRDRLGVLEHWVARLQRGELAAGGDWLDALTLGEIQRLRRLDRAAWRTRPELRLTLLLPLFPHPVLAYQHVSYAAAAAAGAAAGGAAGAGTSGMAVAAAAAVAASAGRKDAAMGGLLMSSPDPSVSGGGGTAAAAGAAAGGGIIRLLDPEVGRDNLAELKAQKLARGLHGGVLDRDLKPNSEERRALQAILKLPPNKPLNGEQRALLWRFRASLTQDNRALTKFLHCVDWSDMEEAKQAADLMRQWAPISAADALELLSPDFRAAVVREHAVAALQHHDPEELSQYLLQLVQALRYQQ
ncbi:hypothetical protein Agub_g242, partial [Astrephomene gubernaculifera]